MLRQLDRRSLEKHWDEVEKTPNHLSSVEMEANRSQGTILTTNVRSARTWYSVQLTAEIKKDVFGKLEHSFLEQLLNICLNYP